VAGFSDGCLDGDVRAGGVVDELEALLLPRLVSRASTMGGIGGGGGGSDEVGRVDLVTGSGSDSCSELLLSMSQLKLSRKPSRSVVSEGENRSAEGGSGGCGGNKFERAGSKVNSKCEKGRGGSIGEVDIE